MKALVVALATLLLAIAPATAGEKPQVFGSISTFYLDAFGVAAGPTLQFNEYAQLSFQLMARRRLEGRPDALLRLGCHTAECAGCRNPSEVGFMVTYTFGSGHSGRTRGPSRPNQQTKR